MTQSWFLPVFLLLLTLPNDVLSTQCCPTCSPQSITPLNSHQLQQIEKERDVIKAMERNPQLVYDRVNQKPIVQLTCRQEQQILRNFPGIFNVGFPSGERNTTGGSEQGRVRRNVAGNCELQRRVCQPVTILKPLILALNSDQQVVQIAQISNQNQYQWILEEVCLSNQTLPPPGGQVCCIAQRFVRGLFINLSIPSTPFDYADVNVHSCVSYYV